MKTWNMRKKKEAVSPVIATILMVAITVVLAAVLYVMVMGFGGDQDQTPSGTFDDTLLSTNQDGSRTYRITLIAISDDIPIADTELAVVGATGTIPTALTSAIAGSTNVGAGDYADVTIAAGDTATITLRDKNNGNAIASITISVPA
ncbi:MAG: type IV pilin N-terminal domain-containing protein [Methanomassiliicoccales archaeon]|nr:MAG: type IV pilin N-terminal domain-containing protein [Methanomassiliicoccales archaeon]